jgi:hypothetical protein
MKDLVETAAQQRLESNPSRASLRATKRLLGIE